MFGREARSIAKKVRAGDASRRCRRREKVFLREFRAEIEGIGSGLKRKGVVILYVRSHALFEKKRGSSGGKKEVKSRERGRSVLPRSSGQAHAEEQWWSNRTEGGEGLSFRDGGRRGRKGAPTKMV